MSANERRQNLLAELFSSRHDTCENLARKLNVTTRTIYSDIEILMCSYPIEAVRGRYGGVRVSDWFYPSSTSLGPKQFALLIKLRNQLSGDDLIVLNSILVQFAP
jgi:predicted DNA-binding transcriptional regulator YafY